MKKFSDLDLIFFCMLTGKYSGRRAPRPPAAAMYRYSTSVAVGIPRSFVHARTINTPYPPPYYAVTTIAST